MRGAKSRLAGGGRETEIQHSPEKWADSQRFVRKLVLGTIHQGRHSASWPSSFALLPHGSCDPRQPEGRPLDRHRRCGCAKQPDCSISRISSKHCAASLTSEPLRTRPAQILASAATTVTMTSRRSRAFTVLQRGGYTAPCWVQLRSLACLRGSARSNSL